VRLASLVIILALLAAACARKPAYPEARAAGDLISVEIPAEGPAFYSFNGDGVKIDFFVVKTAEAVESYFDACYKCYTKKLGYRPDGDEILCLACGVRYSIEELREGIGSCSPVPLAGRVEGGRYVIEKRDLLKGAQYF
jgi:hypothetical protein